MRLLLRAIYQTPITVCKLLYYYLRDVIIIALLLVLLVSGSTVSAQGPETMTITWFKMRFHDESFLLVVEFGGRWYVSSWTMQGDQLIAKFQAVESVSYGSGRPWRFPLYRLEAPAGGRRGVLLGGQTVY